jgi:hypothetical protein
MYHCLSATGILLWNQIPLQGMTLTALRKFGAARSQKTFDPSEPRLARVERERIHFDRAATE